MGLTICAAELGGGFAMPLIGGWVADLTDLRAPMLMCAALSAVGAALSCLLTETRAVRPQGRDSVRSIPSDA